MEEDVRLNANVVQVCRNGQWGLVCDSNNWNSNAVHVACNESGLPFTS